MKGGNYILQFRTANGSWFSLGMNESFTQLKRIALDLQKDTPNRPYRIIRFTEKVLEVYPATRTKKGH
jgi:hypothetical protein